MMYLLLGQFFCIIIFLPTYTIHGKKYERYY